MNLARLLARGVGSWLQFEQASNRSGLFSEKYLALPIGQILSGRLGERVVAEFRHPVLGPVMIGRGRRPEVDFVVLGDGKRIQVAVESKWIGRTTPSVQAVMWDIVRLELIAHEEGAECFFLLGGLKSRIGAFFKNPVFAGNKIWHPSPMIEFRHNNQHRVHLLPVAKHRNDMLKSMFEGYQNFAFPHAIIATRSKPFPAEGSLSLPQVYAWKIGCAEKRQTFLPSKNDTYRTR